MELIAVVSPSKTMREEPVDLTTTEPRFKNEAKKLAQVLRRYDVSQLMDLMGISEKLAITNHDRFKEFNRAREYPAAWLYHGDVFNGLAVEDFSAADMEYAQEHLRILSGLYGLLRPLDAIRPHRLEMGTKLPTGKGKDLYDYWGHKVTRELLKSPQADLLVNLASKEYSRVLDLKTMAIPVLEVEFMEIRQGRPLGIPLFSKKARGSMARYLILQRADSKEALQGFDYDGYEFSERLSNDWKYVFTR